MIIIIEGPNRAGKSTLAGRIAALIGQQYGHATVMSWGPPDPPGRNPFEEYELSLLAQARTQEHVIADRWAMGELVYGPLFRGRSRLTDGGLLHCEMLLRSLGAKRVCLLPSQRVLFQRWEAAPDELSDQHDLLHEHAMFRVLAERFGYMRLIRDPQDETLDVLCDSAQRASTAAEETLSGIPGYIGTPTPSVVLAGDVRSGTPGDDTYVHAFTPAGPGCAGFLMDALAPYSRAVLDHAGILNTGEPGMDLPAADEALGHPRWVALGANAARRLAATGARAPSVSHGFDIVHHPQYARRFRYGDQAVYGKELAGAAQLT